MTVQEQTDLFQLLIADSPSDPRFTPAQTVLFLNEARKWFCEYTRSFQIKDSQTTVQGTSIYSLQNDVINLYSVEYDGVPLDPIDPRDWRGTIGIDDTLQGQPSVYQYFARQLQLFYVPPEAKTLKVYGAGYARDLVVNGGDLDLIDPQARGTVYRAAWQAQQADKEEYQGLAADAMRIAEEFKRQYWHKGPRYVREMNQYRGFMPVRNFNV